MFFPQILSIQKRKVSLERLDHVLPTNVVRESFHRRAGIREMVDTSGEYKLRTVEIKRSQGESVGFYIRQGDGWQRNDGVFVSRVNLGSVVDVNDLLHIGDEIVKVNGTDIAGCPLNEVVSLIQKKRNILRLTVKLPTSQAILRTFAAKQAHINQELPEEEETDFDTLAPMDLLSDIAIHLESTPELNRPHQPLELLQSNHETEAPSTPEQKSLTLQRETFPLEASSSASQKESGDVLEAHDRAKVSEDGTLSVACEETKTSDDDSPESSPPPTPPTSPVPALQDSPSLSPQVSMKYNPLPKFDVDSLSSSSCELTDSLKDLLSPLEKLSPNNEGYPSDSQDTQATSSTNPFSSSFRVLHTPSTSLPPSHPPTPPTSLPPTPPNSHPPMLLPPTPPNSLPPSHPPTPIPLLPSSQPPSPDSSPPPLPKSPPPLLAYEPLTPDTPSHLSPPTTKPRLPSESDDEDIFRLKDVENHLRHWLTHYENSGVDQYTSI